MKIRLLISITLAIFFFCKTAQLPSMEPIETPANDHHSRKDTPLSSNQETPDKSKKITWNLAYNNKSSIRNLHINTYNSEFVKLDPKLYKHLPNHGNPVLQSNLNRADIVQDYLSIGPIEHIIPFELSINTGHPITVTNALNGKTLNNYFILDNEKDLAPLLERFLKRKGAENLTLQLLFTNNSLGGILVIPMIQSKNQINAEDRKQIKIGPPQDGRPTFNPEIYKKLGAKIYGTPYEILQLRPDTTPQEAFYAYRKLLDYWYPRRNTDPEAQSITTLLIWAYTMINKNKSNQKDIIYENN